MTELAWLSATELLAGYRKRDFRPTEVLAACIARIDDANPRLNAFATLSLELAQQQALQTDAAWCDPASVRPLEGVPIAIKDLFDSAGVRTTYGSPMFAEHVPATDAAVTARVKAAGALTLGKTRTHEFGWGITTNSAHFGPTRNPWDPGRSPGGSSGGSGVAIATGMTPLAIGSDTGGSIRIPSGFCGLCGLKPTWGRISLAGAFALARTLDHAGSMARDPADVALLDAVLAAVDGADPATPHAPTEPPAAFDFVGLRVGVAGSIAAAPLAPDVAAVFARACDTAAALGGDVAAVTLPDPAATLAAFVTTQRAEALRGHRARGLYPDRANAYGIDVRGRLEAAERVSLADYLDAQATREQIRSEWERLFRDFDVVLTPISAITAPEIGCERIEHLGKTYDVRELVMSYTVPQNLIGVPACAVPAGFDDHDMPVGVQFTGPWWTEARVLACASAFAAATPELCRRRPD
jgi:aspartyl-tRNA(Asn)/glutamyl-tRNA(Gln) amidotransferase subunit A